MMYFPSVCFYRNKTMLPKFVKDTNLLLEINQNQKCLNDLISTCLRRFIPTTSFQQQYMQKTKVTGVLEFNRCKSKSMDATYKYVSGSKVQIQGQSLSCQAKLLESIFHQEQSILNVDYSPKTVVPFPGEGKEK